MSLNTVWKVPGIENNKYKSCKVIYMLQKIASLEGYDSIIIGYDNRSKSESLATLIAKGLQREFGNVILTERPIPSSLLTKLVSDNIFDMSVYITGDYIDWKTYGFKIKLKDGRSLTFQEAVKIKNLMDSFDNINFNIDWVDTPRTASFDDYYFRKMAYHNSLVENKKLNFKLAFNDLSYTRVDIPLKVLKHFGCKVDAYNADNLLKGKPDPLEGSNIEDNKYFLSLADYDMIFSLTDGEMLSIQTKERVYRTEHIALMLAEIQKVSIKKIVLPERFFHLKLFAKKNKIKYIENNQPYVCRTPCTLVATYNGDIVDSNYSNSMDALYVLLKILDYLETKHISIDDFYDILMETYKIKSIQKTINVNEKEAKVTDIFNQIRNQLRRYITSKSNNKFTVAINDIEMSVFKRNQSVVCEVFYHDEDSVSKYLGFLNEF